MSKIPNHEVIYLIDMDDAVVWCEDPAPGIGMDESDAVKYVKADQAKKITLNGKQLKAVAEFCCPDDGDQDQLETEIVIQWFEESQIEDEESTDECPAGHYARFAEYPEEGWIYLEP